jgi:hypothetical protein
MLLFVCVTYVVDITFDYYFFFKYQIKRVLFAMNVILFFLSSIENLLVINLLTQFYFIVVVTATDKRFFFLVLINYGFFL